MRSLFTTKLPTITTYRSRILASSWTTCNQKAKCINATTTSSVNQTELSHFNNLASTWWDPHGPSRLLHQMNPLRHDFISSCLAPYIYSPFNRRYLDIGCGGGIFAESAARLPRTKSVLAIDPSKDVIEVAKLHARTDPLLLQTGHLTYENKSVEDLPIPNSPQDQFDVVSLFEVIEHIDKPASFLTSCLPFVRPGGWLILSTIARTWTSWLTTKVMAEEVVRMVPRGTHHWEKYINPDELTNWFEERKGWGAGGGMKVIGLVYVPGLGWKVIPRAERLGNFLFGVRRNVEV
ncbi:MAG: hypothetical protein Q9217_000812 [Psora testacea]